MPSLNPKIVLQMLQFGYQHAFFKVWKTLESAFRAVPALLVFLARVPEPKSSCRSLPKCIFQVLPNIFGLPNLELNAFPKPVEPVPEPKSSSRSLRPSPNAFTC